MRELRDLEIAATAAPGRAETRRSAGESWKELGRIE
jgi:hypothetical protein